LQFNADEIFTLHTVWTCLQSQHKTLSGILRSEVDSLCDIVKYEKSL